MLGNYGKENHKLRIRLICDGLNLNRNSYYYEADKPKDLVEPKLLELSLNHKRYGYRKLCQKLRQQEIVVNHAL